MVRTLITDEHGTSSIELMLLLPLAVGSIAFMVWVGQIMLVRQRTIVAARFAVEHTIATGGQPTSSEIARAVTTPGKEWYLQTSTSSGTGQLTGDSTEGLITAAASTTPPQPPILNNQPFRLTRGTYATLNGTWTCDSQGDTSVSSFIAVSFLPIPTTCCESYPSR